MLTASDISTMDPAERVGYLGAFAVFVICGILLVVFGVRRLMKRSEIKRQQQYGSAAPYEPQPYAPPQPYNQQGGYQQPGYQQSGYPTAPANPYGAHQPGGKPAVATQKPPNLALSIVMIVFGALLLLSTLSALAQSSSGA